MTTANRQTEEGLTQSRHRFGPASRDAAKCGPQRALARNASQRDAGGQRAAHSSVPPSTETLPEGASTSSNRERWILGLLVLAVTLLGAYFRLARLDLPALQMDNQDFLSMAQQGVTPSRIFAEWTTLPVGTNHQPFPLAFTMWFLQTFGLPVTFGWLIFPSAVWGILAIPAAFATGKVLRGNAFGLLFASVVALNPICIQISRLAYYYMPAMLGCFISIWAAALFFRVLNTGAIPKSFHVVGPLSAFFMLYSEPAVWPYAGLITASFFGYTGWIFFRHRRLGGDLLVMCLVYAVVCLPILVAPWGIVTVVKSTLAVKTDPGAGGEYWRQVFWNVGSPWPGVWPTLLSYAWGTTPVRSVFSTLVMILGIAGVLRKAPGDRRPVVLFGILVLALMTTVYALTHTVAPFSHARLISVAPLYLLVLTFGLLMPSSIFEGLPALRAVGRVSSYGLIGGALVLAVWPAYLSTQQTGRPRPYKLAAGCVDSILPADTPILTERFFDAYNEFRIHSATNVVFMSTVRNQTASEYLGNHFRERSEAFLTANPVSGVFQSRLLWDHPDVGQWDWPNRFYARRVVVTNEAGLLLCRLGLNDQVRADDHAAEYHFSIPILYNLPEDVVARARKEGSPCVGFFGPGWKYTKTQDYRDWRVLGESAVVEAYNLTTNVLTCELVVRGVAVNGEKHVVVSGGVKKRFESMKLGDAVIGPLTLAPGATRLELKDSYWATRQVPLLAERVDCRKVE